MSNLPQWTGASACYRKAYRVLAAMGRTDSRPTKHGRKVVCAPSDDMRELIDNLSKGDEHGIKATLWRLYTMRPDLASA